MIKTTSFINKFVDIFFMEIELIKHVIEEQKKEMEDKFKAGSIIERAGTNNIKKFISHPNILAILGVRRCGKSILSMLLSKKLNEKSAYINFDDERLVCIKTEDLNKVLQAFYELYGDVSLLIFDEMQNIHGWELFANRLRRTKKVIITGSNSQMLSGELATHLTGRYIDFTLYPFSFKELLGFKPNIYLTEDIAKARKKLKEYIEGSGFPEFFNFGPSIVVKIYENIITKDCISRHKIREEKSFKEMASYLVSNYSNEFTYSAISRLIGIKDVHTVKNYVKYLEEAFLVIVLKRFSPRLKQQIIAPKKVYNIDHGLCNFVGFKVEKNITRIFENIVCVELIRRCSANTKIYYWRDHAEKEIDFLVKEGMNVSQLIQVCYDISDEKTKSREIASLLKGSDELRCNNLLIITDDEDKEEKIEGKKIKYIPLWKWLLEK